MRRLLFHIARLIIKHYANKNYLKEMEQGYTYLASFQTITSVWQTITYMLPQVCSGIIATRKHKTN